jgi:hypothetical protein
VLGDDKLGRRQVLDRGIKAAAIAWVVPAIISEMAVPAGADSGHPGEGGTTLLNGGGATPTSESNPTGPSTGSLGTGGGSAQGGASVEPDEPVVAGSGSSRSPGQSGLPGESGSGSLPFTGAEVAAEVVIGVALVAGGAAAVASARRRAEAQPPPGP